MLYVVGQDGVYQSLQSVVDWFREAVGIPMEKKYNTVLFGGIYDSLHNITYVSMTDTKRK